MPLVTRNVTNVGDPLYAPDGTLLVGVQITFTLVTGAGQPTDAWDATTFERVVGSKVATTNASGEFTVALWPNSRGNKPTKYLCEVAYPGAQTFRASVDAGGSDLQWVDFFASGVALSAAELSALSAHIVDTTAAHAASAISVSAIAGRTSINVQDMLAELDVAIDSIAPTWAALTGKPASVTSIGDLTPVADKVPYYTGAATAALADFTAVARTLVAATTQAAQRTALGLVIGTNVQAYAANLDLWAAVVPASYATLASPTFTGTPLAPTAAASTNTTQIATTAFVMNEVSLAVAGLLDFKGNTDASTNPNYPAASKGDSYVVSVAGKVGGASGKSVDVGDLYVASADNAGGTEAAVGTSWFVLEHNLTGALLSANNLSDLANAATARTNLGLVIGTNVQAYDAELAALAGLTSAADKLPYFTGSGTAGVTDFSTFARTLIDDADAATMRTTLGLGTGNTPTFTGITLTGGTVTASAPLITGTQTWNNGAVAFTADVINITNTASAAGSLLIDRQVGGVSQFTVRKDGNIATTGNLTLGAVKSLNGNGLVIQDFSGGGSTLKLFAVQDTGASSTFYWDNGGTFRGRSTNVYGWTASGSDAAAALDTGLARAAATIVDVNNGAAGGGGALRFNEMTAPAAPAANKVHLYAEDNGAGKTRLMALFASGAAQQIAIEP